MTDTSDKEDLPLSLTDDETETPSKKRRLNANGNWAFGSGQTEQEILNEMGFCLLSQEDTEASSDIDKNVSSMDSRKRNMENVNPNVNSCLTSPTSSLSPKHSRSPSPGPSRGKCPRSTEKYSLPLQPIVETAVLQLLDEETPLPQLPVTRDYLTNSQSPNLNRYVPSPDDSSCYLSLPYGESSLIEHRTKYYNDVNSDAFSILSDEVMLSIFKWLPKWMLITAMRVCKRWYRIASDETYWQRLDLASKHILPDGIGKILNRKPVIVRLALSEISEWTNHSGFNEPSRIQFLDLSMCIVDLRTLNSLIERCPTLRKLSLEFVTVDTYTCELLGRCSRLETLNLSMATGITSEGLQAILQGCSMLQALNMAWCQLHSSTLEVLCSSLTPRIQRLNLAGAKNMSDDMVSSLITQCPHLLELDLSDCSQLTERTVTAMADLNRLNHLAISRCYLIPPLVLTKFKDMPSLQYLDVWGMLQQISLRALKRALPDIKVNEFTLSAVARPTVDTKRTSIWGIRTRD